MTTYVAGRCHISRHVNNTFDEGQTFGDRLAASHDYEVNLKAELEIMGLHEKLDRIRSQYLEELMRAQQQ